MGFDCKKFMKQGYSARTRLIPVGGLASLFGDDADAEWLVRGLSGSELAKCKEAAESNKRLAEAMAALADGNAADVIEHMKASMGLGDDVPADTVQRMNILVHGSVEPEVSLEMAVKLNEHHPIEFYTLTNAINELTGAGSIMGKPKACGEVET